jgi:ribosomal protein S6--L-glutamate ligase
MKIGILTATISENEFISQWVNIKKAGEKLGVEVDLFKNGEFELSINNGFQIFYKNTPFKVSDYSIFYNGIGTSVHHTGNFYIPEVLLYMGVKVFNKPNSIGVTRDKLKTLNILTKNNVKLTPSYIIRRSEDLDFLPPPFNEYPLIVKRIFGSKGKSVVRVDDVFQLKSIFDFGWNADRNDIFLIQPFIGNMDAHTDIRVIVLGNKVVGAMKRVAKKGDFRTNFSLNRTVEPIELTDFEKSECERVSKVMDLEYAGIDFIRTDDGPVFLEVNGTPGFTGINSVFEQNGRNFFDEFIEFSAKLSLQK